MVSRQTRSRPYRRYSRVTGRTGDSGLSTEQLAGVALTMREIGVELVGPLQATLIAGGRSNMTWAITDGAERWVLRTPPMAGRTASAHDVAREHRVTEAL